MKFIRKYVFILSTVCCCTTVLGQPVFEKQFDDIVRKEQKTYLNKLKVKAPLNDPSYDLIYQRCEWVVNPEIHYITGVITSYFIPLQTSFDTLKFDCSPLLQIDSILYNGSQLFFSQSNDDKLNIGFTSSLAQGNIDPLTVYYQGAPDQTGFGAFTKSMHDSTSIIWTHSEPYGSKEWWPCKQSLDDKIDSIDVIVKTPSMYRVAGNGLLVNEFTVDSSKVYHWKHRYPIPAYLVAIAITNYSVYCDTLDYNGKKIEILNYIYPEDSATLRAESSALLDVMKYFIDTFGDYPFDKEKYGHAQFGWQGGMEHQTMSFMYNFDYGLMVHELAHQWFGNKITCGTWKDIWLNEGFATYLTALAYENVLEDDTLWTRWKSVVKNKVLEEDNGSVWVDDTTDVKRIFNGRLTYFKGAFVLHMLRWKLGDTDFFQSIQNYITDNNHTYGYAQTTDLISHLESISGQNLAEFFNDWFYGEGHPTYSLTWSKEGSTVQFSLEQTTSHSSVDFFEMPIPILFEGDNQDTIVVIDHTFSGQEFNISLPFEPKEVVFDPDIWILAKSEVIFKITNDKDVFEIKTSPNPIEDLLNVSLEGKNNQKIEKIEIINNSGQIVYENTDINSKTATVAFFDYDRGMYIIKITSGQGTTYSKMIKY